MSIWDNESFWVPTERPLQMRGIDRDTVQLIKQRNTSIAAAAASASATIVSFPMDSIKTRMQSYRFQSVMQCMKYTYKAEGLIGFWRGALAPLFSIGVVRTFSMTLFEATKHTFGEVTGQFTGTNPLDLANGPQYRLFPTTDKVACVATAGAVVGGIITFVSCPFELTKLNAQIAVLMETGRSKGSDAPLPPPIPKGPRIKHKTMGTFRTVRYIYKQRGFNGLYTGLNLHLYRDIVGTGLYFGIYEVTRHVFDHFRALNPEVAPEGSRKYNVSIAVAGALCGTVSWAMIYPIDSAKSIYQRNVLSNGKEFVPVPKVQFFNRRMYAGLGISMLRSASVNGLFFVVFETVKNQLVKLDPDEYD